MVKSLYTTHFVPMNGRGKSERMRDRNRQRKTLFLVDCLRARVHGSLAGLENAAGR